MSARFRLYIIDKVAGKNYLIPDWTRIEWWTDKHAAALRFTIDLDNNTGEYTWISEGDLALLHDAEFGEVWRGVVWTPTIAKHAVISGFDHMVYLQNAQVNHVFERVTASDVHVWAAQQAGIPVGRLANTGVLIKQLICRDMTLYDLMQKSLRMTHAQTDRRFESQMRQGQLELIDRLAVNDNVVVIDSEKNLITGQAIHDVRPAATSVFTHGATLWTHDDETTPTEAEESRDEGVGVLRRIWHDSEARTDTRAESISARLDNEWAIRRMPVVLAHGNSGVRSGRRVIVRDKPSAVLASAIVERTQHTLTDGAYHMLVESRVFTGQDAIRGNG